MPLDDIRQARLQKLETIIKSGEEPYPAKSWRTHTIAQSLENFDSFVENRNYIVLNGRIRGRREHGGSTFIDLEDGSGTIQLFFKRDKIGDREYDFFLDTVDVGDFIEVYGVLFLTKQFERTLEVEKYRILSKALLPLPEKWHGLQDTEERFRKRYLDLIFNPEVKSKFRIRSQIIQAMRDFLNQADFIEVTTPTLQLLYGGASARPFKTHMHTLDLDLYLRIAPELYLKRLIIGGLDAVYEFTTNFRNEGMDRNHNPEFSALEFYVAYKDHEWAMGFVENLLSYTLEKVFGSLTIKYQDAKIHFSQPYTRISFNDLLKQYTGITYDEADQEDFAHKARELGINIEKAATKGQLADEIFKKAILDKLIQPTFVTDYPADVLPLAKRIKNTEFVGSFQFFAGGFELMKAFTELNDPIDQRQRFEAQEHNRAKGDEEAQRLDEDFIEALEYGMPPTAGVGIGLDRLIALLTDSHSIREIIPFPLMKPKQE